MRQKKCRNCGEVFEPNRSDQRFCKNKCRNAFNNNRYKLAIAPFELEKRDSIDQDEVLQQLLLIDTTVLIAENQFEHLKIYPQRAKQLHFDGREKLIKLVFTRFILMRINEIQFQLKRK